MKGFRSQLMLAFASASILVIAATASAQVRPGDVITRANATKVANLVSPGNYMLVQQGMVMKIVPTTHLDWPPPYRAATEQYSPQVQLTVGGNIQNYKAGLPFPLVDVNDPYAAQKIMWNFEFRPLYTDDVDARNVQVISHRPGQSGSVEAMTFGNFGFYKSIGRTEVAPMPIDNDIYQTGIAYRSGVFPVLEPEEMHGAGIVREGFVQPNVEDQVWEYSPETRRLRRLPATELSDAFGVASRGGAGSSAGGVAGATTYASTLDPDSSFGFDAKLTDYSYRLLGERPMLAVTDAANSPEQPCPYDGGRSVCPENWQMRNVYIIEADAKPRSPLSDQVIVPRRILYIDSEGWFITASDLFHPNGELWKTIATFHAYRDRSTPYARVAVWPYKRMFQTAMVDEDVTTGFSTTVYSPSTSGNSECWYINSGVVDKDFFTPARLEESH
ncbi:MAG TPA: DUF1329 domain-containing protein [Candidatus Binataceae bacterium]|nr:DUF1329 domain-containing protein [Candidatus Binataceae bacterium]